MTDVRKSLTTSPFDDGGAIAVFGNRYDIGTRVVRWDHPNGFDGYTRKRVVLEEQDRKTGRVKRKVIKGLRFSRRSMWGVKSKLKRITQFFVHHSGGDGRGAQNIYNTLYMHRKLSVQFVVDDTGEIYQFNDAGDACWHAGKHNPCSIGVECALYPLANKNPHYYSERRNARFGNLPHEVVADTIHGKTMTVFAFTEPQVEALARLAAGCWFALSEQRAAHGINALPWPWPPTFPRNGKGEIPHTVVPRAIEHMGLIGHLQCTKRKIDPAGFPWEAFEERVAQRLHEFAINGEGT